MIHSQSLSNEHAKLYVVTCISNPCRYASRYKLYREFEKRTLDAGAILYTIEMAYGNRKFELTEANDPTDIQIRNSHELWHKETLLNIAISRLPQDAEYIAWVDADIQFVRPDWVVETIHQLQHFDVVQMFSHAQDMCPNFQLISSHKGFVYSYFNNLPSSDGYYYPNYHPGYCWAYRKSALNQLGGLIDTGILGASDRHMAFGLIGRIEDSMPRQMRDTPYHRHLEIWEERARDLHKNIGYVDGTINHYFHGKKIDRRYNDRWKILVHNNFNPDLDLKRDVSGLWQLTNRNYKLRDDIRKYFRGRNEDSIDL